MSLKEAIDKYLNTHLGLHSQGLVVSEVTLWLEGPGDNPHQTYK